MFKNIYIKITNSELKFIIPFTEPSTLLSCMLQIVYAMSQISIYVNMFTDALRQKLRKNSLTKEKLKHISTANFLYLVFIQCFF